MGYYEPINITEYFDQDTHRYRGVKNLKLSEKFSLLTLDVGGPYRSIYYIYKCPEEGNKTQELQMLNELLNKKPEFKSQAQRKEFVE